MQQHGSAFDDSRSCARIRVHSRPSQASGSNGTVSQRWQKGKAHDQASGPGEGAKGGACHTPTPTSPDVTATGCPVPSQRGLEMTRRKKPKGWSYLAGEKGRNRIRAFELATGMLYLEYMDSGKRCTSSLGHRDRVAAKQKADELAAHFGESSRVERTGELTLGVLFDNYLHEVTPGKTLGTQKHDQHRARLWIEVFGRNQPVAALNATHAKLFIQERKARGDLRRGVGGKKRNATIRPRSWRMDLALLKSAIRWAIREGLLKGYPGIIEYRDRTKGEVRRPIVSELEVGWLLETARQVGTDCHCFAILAHETGHRSGAIRQLRWNDIDFVNETVRWRPELDKIGYDHSTPLSPVAIEALSKYRSLSDSLGEMFLFPAPKTLGSSASNTLVRDWWERMERLAGMQPVPGRGWHSLRRKFASDLKRRSLVDVAALGGWKDTTTITRSYQQPDAASMREALMSRRDPLTGPTAEGTAEVPKIRA